MKHALIVGGSSGLGLEIAKKLSKEYSVTITGTGKHQPEGFDLREIDLTNGPELLPSIKNLIKDLPEIDTVVYAVGFAQLGTITDLEDGDIGAMALTGLVAPALLIRELLRKQGKIANLVVITSTSAWTPRLKEPMYTASKAGLGMLANSLSLDERIGRTLVAAPGGMDTPFWDGTGTDTSKFLDVKEVASHIIDALSDDYSYRLVKIPRDTGKPEVVESR